MEKYVGSVGCNNTTIQFTSEQLDSLTSIYDIFKLAGEIAYKVKEKDVESYSCTKIECSQHIQDIVFKFHEIKGDKESDVAMHWCIFGPKVNNNLKENEVRIYDGFILFDNGERSEISNIVT